MPNLMACGSNNTGLLSLGHREDVSTLQMVKFHPSVEALIGTNYRVIDLVSASAHSLLLLETSSGERLMLGAGLNTLGQLGPRCALWDDVRAEERFMLVNLLGGLDLDHKVWKPMHIAVTWTTSFVVYERNNTAEAGSADVRQGAQAVEQILLSCGSNDFGELGLPASGDDDGKVPITTPSARPTVVDIGLRPGERLELLKGGQRHVLAVIGGNDRQRVVGWGGARKGELTPDFTADTSRKGKGKGKGIAQPTSLPPTEVHLAIPTGLRIVDLALGASHSICLLSGGSVLAWGSDGKGQISGLSGMKGVQAIAATWNGSYILTENKIWSQGSNTHSQLLRSAETAPSRGLVVFEEGLKVESIVAGTEHLIVLATDGLWLGGWNEHGNLGLGDQVDRRNLTRVLVAGKILRIWGACAATWILVDGA